MLNLHRVLASVAGVMYMAKDSGGGVAGGAAASKDKPADKPADSKSSAASQESPLGSQRVPDEMPPDAMEGQEISKKISPKEIVGDLKKMVMSGDLKLPCDLYTVIGRAGNIREGESTYGPWVAALGEFEATQLIGDKKTFIGTQLFLPGPAGELLIEQIRRFTTEPIEPTEEQKKKGGGRTYKTTGEYVELALIVAAKVSDRAGGAPYEYVVRPLEPIRKHDALAHLRAKVQQKLLAAPSKK